MTNFEKLQNLIKYPEKFYVKKGTRVYRMLKDIYIYGVVQTGYSDRRSKYIETQGVFNALYRAGVPCECYNVAPRGGACGERVRLKGKVFKDVTANFDNFMTICKNDANRKNCYPWNVANDYIKALLS